MSTDTEVSKGIVTNSHRCGGTPTIKGTRITARHIGELVREGMDPVAIMEDYPSLSYTDLANARAFSRREDKFDRRCAEDAAAGTLCP